MSALDIAVSFFAERARLVGIATFVLVLVAIYVLGRWAIKVLRNPGEA